MRKCGFVRHQHCGNCDANRYLALVVCPRQIEDGATSAAPGSTMKGTQLGQRIGGPNDRDLSRAPAAEQTFLAHRTSQ